MIRMCLTVDVYVAQDVVTSYPAPCKAVIKSVMRLTVPVREYTFVTEAAPK